MADVTVPVLKPLVYQGRSYVRGQTVKVAPVEALAMARRGEVSLSRDTYVAPVVSVETRDLVSEAQVAPVVRTRRAYTKRSQYKRRDMAPEQSIE